MRWSAAYMLPAVVVFCVACSDADQDPREPSPSSSADVDSGGPGDAAGTDSEPRDAGTALTDGGDAADAAATCSVSGAPGQCVTVPACAALSDHTSFVGHCSGPASIECCIKTPSTADNPPVPAGYKPMVQSQVTPEMTTWAVTILHDSATYPMFATAMKTFGTLAVLARVEWHPPDFQNGAIHRGVTLYEPL